MGHHYFWLIDHQNPGTDMTVLRTSDGVEEIFVPAVGWRPSQASERAHLLSGETDERDARAILDRVDQNRFRPIDFPYRYFLAGDVVLRRWTDDAGEHEQVLDAEVRWQPSDLANPACSPITPETVDRIAAERWERDSGVPRYFYFTVGDSSAVVRERPATGEFETYTDRLEWIPGVPAGDLVPINRSRFAALEQLAAEQRNAREPHRYYAVVTDDHPNPASPAAVVRHHICASCLPTDEVHSAEHSWLPTNAVIAIRAGERPGRAVEITQEAALAVPRTPGLAVEPPPHRPLFRYFAVGSQAVVRRNVETGVEECYTEALRWEQAPIPAGDRVPVLADAATRFEEEQFRRVFGETEFRYLAVLNALHPDPADPAAVVRVTTDDQGVRIVETHGPGHQWVNGGGWREHQVVSAEEAAFLREICDSRSPRYYYRGRWTGRAEDVPETVTRYWNDFGTIRGQACLRSGWGPAFDHQSLISLTHAYSVRPLDLDAVRRFQARDVPPPPPPPQRDYAYSAVVDELKPRPWALRGLVRVHWKRGHAYEESLGAGGKWHSSWIQDDYSRGKNDLLLIGLTEEEGLRLQEELPALWARRQVPEFDHYAVTDASHPLRDPVALIRVRRGVTPEAVEEFVLRDGFGCWDRRDGRPPGVVVPLTAAVLARLEERRRRRPPADREPAVHGSR